MWHFAGSKKQALISKVLDRGTRRVVGWVFGYRDIPKFPKIYLPYFQLLQV